MNFNDFTPKEQSDILILKILCDCEPGNKRREQNFIKYIVELIKTKKEKSLWILHN